MSVLTHVNRKLSCASSFLLLTAGVLAQTDDPGGQWRIAGRDLGNTRNQPTEHKISPSTAAKLAAKWVFTTGSDVSATPTVAGNSVYFPDWAGNLYAVRANTGELLWTRKISDYNQRANSVSRTSPAVADDLLIIGDNVAQSALHSDGAHVMAIDRNSGQLRWITQVDPHPAAIITASPIFSGNLVYVGVSSAEEGLATNPAYPCCTFRGSMVAVNVNTGAIVWKTYTVPENGGKPDGYSGNAIWGPAAIDTARGSLYIGTGNNYTVPASVLACQSADPTRSDCTAPDDHFNSVLALDLQTGAIRWARRLAGFDVWTVACLSQPQGVNCPSPSGPDFDFGSGPNLLDNMVGIGQKSGVYWALNQNNGSIIWSTVVGPGGTLGGIEWGSATDGRRIYVAIGNNAHKTYTLANGGPTIDWGSWAALDPGTGKILWQIADPVPGSTDVGAVSVANDVMYAGSYSGHMYAIEAPTGKILWSFNSGGSVIDGPSIVNGNVYWGSGYRRIRPGTGNNKVYAFGIEK